MRPDDWRRMVQEHRDDEARRQLTWQQAAALRPSAAPLTPRQREVLRAIVALFRERGRMPSVRELCIALGAVRLNAMMYHLQALTRKGYLESDHQRARSLRLTGAVVRLEYAATAAGERLRAALEGDA